ncbi:MAG: hypothetical protein MZV49_02065 [Rhodopseudomonas palustris]|nr:hypothetical protein [Rhodopseudomonas palustris]
MLPALVMLPVLVSCVGGDACQAGTVINILGIDVSAVHRRNRDGARSGQRGRWHHGGVHQRDGADLCRRAI